MTEQTAATPAPKPEVKPAAQPPKRRNRFVRRIHRHHRVLTFIGALIVFFTFIVKDALRDQFKDLADSISSAEAVFAIRRDSVITTMLLTKINYRMMEQEVASNQIKLSPDVKGIDAEGYKRNLELTAVLTKQIGPVFESLTVNHLFIDMATALANKLPRHNRQVRSKELQDIFSRMNKTADACNVFLQKFTGVDQHSFFEASHKVEGLLRESELITSDSEKLVGTVIDEAKSSEQYYEHRYKIATWASWFLYAFGWGLGLIARLSGLDTSVGE